MILWIIEDGTEVKPGDELVRLDASSIEDNISQQKIAYQTALAQSIHYDSSPFENKRIKFLFTGRVRTDRCNVRTRPDPLVTDDWRLRRGCRHHHIRLLDRHFGFFHSLKRYLRYLAFQPAPMMPTVSESSRERCFAATAPAAPVRIAVM